MTLTAPTELRIASDLSLPLDAVTQTLAILAKREAGKTYTASVLVEELLKADLPVVVVDPLGVWWGLRSAADGVGPGLPIAILGGKHGDIPLEPTAGKLVADLVIAERVSMVLDVSRFDDDERQLFVTDFAERIYAGNEEPLHLVFDEADLVAPQATMAGERRMVRAINNIVRRGRTRGLGSTLITQRSAELAKGVLSQTEVLIALRTNSPHDRDAIEAWVKKHIPRTDSAEGLREASPSEVMASLPSLPIGTAWVWSPGWLGLLRKVRIRQRETFDSSATPKAGQATRAPKTFAEVDLQGLQWEMASMIERAEADDPERLRRTIAGLRQDLATARAAAPAQVVERRVEVRVPDEGLIARFEAGLAELGRILSPVSGAAEELKRVSSDLGAVGDELGAALASVRPGSHGGSPVAADAEGDRQERRPAARAEVVGAGAAGDTAAAEAGDVDLSKGARALLGVFAQHYPLQLTRLQWATLARRGKRSSSYSLQITELVRAELAEEVGKRLRATEKGLAVAGRSGRPPETAAEILQAWRDALPDGPRTMLDAVLAAGEPLPRDELARRAGFSPTSSSVSVHLKVLRDNDLVEETPPPDRRVRIGGALAALAAAGVPG
jgi:hypothetical protein